MRKNPMLHPLSKRRLGFTLIEAAIVLGAVGIVMGAIWEVSQSVRNSQHLGRTVQQVAQVTQNIREYYMNAQGIPLGAVACGGDITPNLDTAGLFLAEMRRVNGASVMIDHPYSSGSATVGSFRVLGATCPGTTASRFRIVLSNLSPAACTDLLFSGVSFKDQGITALCGGSNSTHPCYSNSSAGSWPAAGWSSIGCNSGICGVCSTVSGNRTCSTMPSVPTLAQIQTACTPAAGTSTSEVGWEFTVRD